MPINDDRDTDDRPLGPAEIEPSLAREDAAVPDKEGDRVGRNRPPKRSQFKPGQSGNPRGRPKRSKNLRTVVSEVMTQNVTYPNKGKRITVPAAQAALNKALGTALKTGSVRDTIALFQLAERYGLAADDAGPGGLAPLQPADEADLADFLRRVRQDLVVALEEAPQLTPEPNEGTSKVADPAATDANAVNPADDTLAPEMTAIDVVEKADR